MTHHKIRSLCSALLSSWESEKQYLRTKHLAKSNSVRVQWFTGDDDKLLGNPQIIRGDSKCTVSSMDELRACLESATANERKMVQFERKLDQAQGDFKKLPMNERQRIAFKTCGCIHAYPTWWMRIDGIEQVDCCHLRCLIARKEIKCKPWIYKFNSAFRCECNNWLRFAIKSAKGRQAVARLYWAMKKQKRFDIMAAVHVGVMA